MIKSNIYNGFLCRVGRPDNEEGKVFSRKKNLHTKYDEPKVKELLKR